ncbi:MAG: hypothetical protein JST16_12775 [Bdellovibrionales bacterium]|nr:hypothetical protein [Bdellovibrionales bacterium]
MALFFRREPRDWVGLWYAIARERGVSDLVRFMRIDAVRGCVVETVDLSHEKMDGVGALTSLLRQSGCRVERATAGRTPPAPRGWALLKLIWNFSKAVRNMSVNWKHYDATAVADPLDIAWTTLSHRETEIVQARAKAAGASLNAYLLSQLSNVVSKDLVAGAEPFLWLFPVNMRGPVKCHDETANYSSAVGIACHKQMTALEVQANIREQLSKNIHWATWWMLNIGKIVGERGMRWLSKHRADNNFWMGTFSNLGVWPPEGVHLNRFNADELWIPCPPGTLNFPIGCCVVVWNGRLALTLKMHAALGVNFAQVQAYLQELRRNLLGAAPELAAPGSWENSPALL